MNEFLFRLINDGIKCAFLDQVLPVFSARSYVVLPGFALFVLALCFGGRRTRACMAALVMALLCADKGSENLLKNLFDRSRPYDVLQGVHVHYSDGWSLSDPRQDAPFSNRSHSFPSSHASNVAAAAAVLAFLNRKTLWASIPVALLVGLSRVYTGNHYPGDVLAGYVWGGICGAVASLVALGIARKVWGETPEAPRLPMPQDRKIFLWVLALWAFVSLAFVYLNRFGLAEDEAQYWDWSRRLALGYYSKPPMIAYVIHILTHAAGDREWAIRSGAVMCSLGTLALLYALTLRITKRDRAALMVACITLAMPFTWAGSVLMTIDPLLAFFWTLSMYAFHRAVNGEPKMWWLTGLALGLGMLSKYTVILLIVSFALYLLLVDRTPLKTFGPYAAIAIMLVCLSGVIYWNAANNWVSLRHTASIGASAGKSFSSTALHFLEYFAAQAGAVSPILFGLFVWAMTALARRCKRNRDAAFLFLCGIVLFVFYAAVALTRKTEPNWPACAYLAAVPALAWVWTERPRGPGMRRLLVAGILLGCLIGVGSRSTNLIYALSDRSDRSDGSDRIKLGRFSINPRVDPTNRLIGGRELGAALGKYVENASDPPFIFTPRYQLTAWAAFYTPGRPRTYYANPEQRYNQYDLWGGWNNLVGRDALFVSGGDEASAREYIAKLVSTGAFDRGECLEIVRVYRGKTLIKQFSISKLYRYSGHKWTKEAEKF
jgi:membrane-associated phospholipid phosphatase